MVFVNGSIVYYFIDDYIRGSRNIDSKMDLSLGNYTQFDEFFFSKKLKLSLILNIFVGTI